MTFLISIIAWVKADGRLVKYQNLRIAQEPGQATRCLYPFERLRQTA
jgi:hypothetical protein